MYNSIPREFLIINYYQKKKFIKETFNGYKKNEVFNEIYKNILSGNIEKSILWSTELHCSGYIDIFYEKLLNLFITDINKANLNIIDIFINDLTILEKKKKIYNNINEFSNDQFIRNHISNIVSILAFSPKYKLDKLPVIKTYDLNMNNNKNRIISKNLNEIQIFIKKNDPKNIIIPLSEILLNLKNKNISKSLENTLFWLNWIIFYEKNFHKGNLKCSKRNIENIDIKYTNDFTWIIWDIINSISDNIFIKKLFYLYKFSYNKSKKNNKINIIILAFNIIIDPFPYIEYNKKIIDDDNNIKRIKIISNINYQYYDTINNNKKIINTKDITSNNNSSNKENNFSIFAKYSISQSDKTIEYINKFSHINSTKYYTKKNKYPKNSSKKYNHLDTNVVFYKKKNNNLENNSDNKSKNYTSKFNFDLFKNNNNDDKILSKELNINNIKNKLENYFD